MSRSLLSTLMPCLLGVVFLPSLAADEVPIPDTQDPRDQSLTPAESLARIEVPEGFHVTLFAGEPDIRRPIAFDFDDRGRLWVVENYSHPQWRAGEGVDRIVVLEDRDHDGTFDQRQVFWNKGRYLTGIAVGHGGVWIANTPELSFIPDRDGDDVPDSPPIVKLDGFAFGNGNNCLNNFHWGPDGWLYGAVGLADESFVGKPGADVPERTLITRGMWRFHPVKETFEVLARGMVNPWGADFNEVGDLFTSNTVIAHLWHIVPGMYCQRRGFETDNPYVYERIQSIADHLHWGGGKWQASRSNEQQHQVAGGGHAHCGGMIYLGDNFPDEYRGTFFTGNLHGNRLNNDQLVPHESSYVGIHREDFFHANDSWFRSLTQKYGPDGGVYLSDWHDLGECHDKDGSHRSSGRIYKVVYGRPATRDVDLQRCSPAELVQLHRHRNAWYPRHARRILHERAVAGKDLEPAERELRAMFHEATDTVIRLRALWTLFTIGRLDADTLVDWSSDPDSHIRRWAVKLLGELAAGDEETLRALQQRALDEAAHVRLMVASTLQRLPLEARWDVAEGLLGQEGDLDDAYLPLMIWYGIEPLVPRDIPRALRLVAEGKIPLLQQYAARRAVEKLLPETEDIIRFILDRDSEPLREALLSGVVEATADASRLQSPTGWEQLYAEIRAGSNDRLQFLAARLATVFGDARAIATLRRTVADSQAASAPRRAALEALLQLSDEPPRDLLLHLLGEATPLRADALAALELLADRETGSEILRRYPELTAKEQHLAVAALVTGRDTARQLLSAVEAGKISPHDVSVFALQQLRSFKDAEIRRRVGQLWKMNSAQVAKSEQMAYYRKLLRPEYIEAGNASAGRLTFEATCAKCHQLFGEGSSLAPDLTGSGRSNVDYLLSNLIDPSGLVDPAYRLTTAVTIDGRVLHGFIVKLTEQHVLLRTQAGQVRLRLDHIDDLETSSISMMPEGLLQSYTNEQVRNLVKYLTSHEQVPLPQRVAP